MSNSAADCPACGSQNWLALERIDVESQSGLYAPSNEVLRESMTAEIRHYTAHYQMYLCKECGLEAADPFVNPGSAWYAMAYKALSLYPECRWEYARVLSMLTTSNRIADFGCGSGKFLAACQLAGFNAVGFDFSPQAIKVCEEQGLNANIIAGKESQILSESHTPKFSHITSFHVLEHLDDPAWFFNLAAASTLADGHLLISVPSDRRSTRVFGETDFLDQPPHHLSRWTASSLKSLGQRSGWVLQGLEYEPWPLALELWARAIRQPGYRLHNVSQKSVWQERLMRLAYYPGAFLQTLLSAQRISGFSMLAHFVKSQ